MFILEIPDNQFTPDTKVVMLQFMPAGSRASGFPAPLLIGTRPSRQVDQLGVALSHKISGKTGGRHGGIWKRSIQLLIGADVRRSGRQGLGKVRQRCSRRYNEEICGSGTAGQGWRKRKAAAVAAVGSIVGGGPQPESRVTSELS
jgi:hypothetical protein